MGQNENPGFKNAWETGKFNSDRIFCQTGLKLLLKSLVFSPGNLFAGKSLRLPEMCSHFFPDKRADNKLQALTKTVQNFLPCDALLDERIKSCHSPPIEQLESERKPNWSLGNYRVFSSQEKGKFPWDCRWSKESRTLHTDRMTVFSNP